jgi:hypothetical protein
MADIKDTSGPEDLASLAELMQAPERPPVPTGNLAEAGGTPKITRMPEGIEVVERRLGQATAQWVLQVHCECGRRWFEKEAVEAAQCPRCGLLVLVKIEPR